MIASSSLELMRKAVDYESGWLPRFLLIYPPSLVSPPSIQLPSRILSFWTEWSSPRDYIMLRFFRREPYQVPSRRKDKGKESRPDELHNSLIDVSPETRSWSVCRPSSC